MTILFVEFSENIATNVEFLEQRARDAAQQEMERSHMLDQKAAGLIAAALVLTAAGVTFASRMNELHAGHGARMFWAILMVVVLLLLFVSLCFATAAIRPQAYRTVVHIDELNRWPTARHLDRDSTRVRGEQMMASIGAVGEARPINKSKGSLLLVAFAFFAAAIASIVILGSAVSIHLAEATHHSNHHVPRRQHPAAARRSRSGAIGAG